MCNFSRFKYKRESPGSLSFRNFTNLLFWHLRLKHYPVIFFPVNCDADRLIKSDMPDELIFVKGRLTGKKTNVIKSIMDEWVYCKITNPERGQVLEKVCALAGINPVMFEA